MATKRALLTRIDKFLTVRKPSDGGYAEVSAGEMQQLHEIVDMLVQLKYEADPDGDRPVEAILTDRTRYERPLHIPVAYSHKPQQGRSELELLQRGAEAYATLARWAADASQRSLQAAITMQSQLVETQAPIVLGGVQYTVKPPAGLTMEAVKTHLEQAVRRAAAKAAPAAGLSERTAWAQKLASSASKKLGVMILALSCSERDAALRVDFRVPAFQSRVTVNAPAGA